jgi:hypothetical protein
LRRAVAWWVIALAVVVALGIGGLTVRRRAGKNDLATEDV